MPLRRREIELTVERPLAPGTGEGNVRLSARFETGEGGTPTPRELAEALEKLRADLDALVGPPLAAAGIAPEDRSISELVNAYRPRQRELVDLLLAEGEITSTEHTRMLAYLTEYLAAGGSVPPAEAATAPSEAAPAAAPMEDQPIAAVPIIAERGAEGTRSVPELIRTYQIESLKQAGAVRARRQISFSEYMSLKRHFESGAAAIAASKPTF